MAAAKKKKMTTRWNVDDVPVEELAPSEQIAHEIVLQFGDLAPSVSRIMESELSDDERLSAMTLFQTALSDIDDPNRDPRVAIATAGGD